MNDLKFSFVEPTGHLFQVEKEDEKKIKSSDDIQLPTSKNLDSCTDNIAPGQHDTVDRKQDENNADDAIRNKEIFQEDCSEDPDKGRLCPEQSDKIGMIQRRSAQPSREDDTHKSRNSTNDDDYDNDGFKTPTSSDHKIPVMTTCPPAPKKSSKRKFSASPSIQPTLHVDFNSTIDEEEDLGIKKVRKIDHQE
ncbi:hypothetical protein RND71_003833 [Anisodus tanguticus]|uniref:Uncharacterized protein n=1 Tax=Anisodus tanguticus TaxID=243964 RepID=A0AAE1SYK2_9SOLA|nr:hypothetical protein RND71_003833 [Anisodus tanguticus]